MINELLLVCMIWGGFLLILTIAFGIIIYNRTKDFKYTLKTWKSRHDNDVNNLTKNENRLLNIVGKLERGLGYYKILIILLLFLNAIFMD